MNRLAAIRERAAQDALAVFGAFHPVAKDAAPAGTGTLILLGPQEPGFWDHVIAMPEFRDGTPNPLDRWSRRITEALARDLGGQALLPFDGPPWHSFIAWARASGQAWPSPVTLLVHDVAGLMVSYRGAIALPERIDLPRPGHNPCPDCADQPCRGACPVNALTAKGYDVDACKSHLASPGGADCRTLGCRVRRACPISQGYDRRPEQSAHHMSYFFP